jgi:uncharacterized protein YpbB
VTIEDHLVEAIEAGERVNLDRLVSPRRRAEIEAAISRVGADLLRPIMDELDGDCTWAEIKYVRAALRSGG